MFLQLSCTEEHVQAHVGTSKKTQTDTQPPCGKRRIVHRADVKANKQTCNAKQNHQGRYRSISRHTQPRGRHPQPVRINLEAHTTMVTSSYKRVDGTTLESKSPTAKAEPINLKAHSPRVPQTDLGWRRNTERTLVCKCLAENINTRRAGNKTNCLHGA